MGVAQLKRGDALVVFGEAGARGRHKTVGEQTAAPITGRRLLEASNMCVVCWREHGDREHSCEENWGNFWGRVFTIVGYVIVASSRAAVRFSRRAATTARRGPCVGRRQYSRQDEAENRTNTGNGARASIVNQSFENGLV